MYVEPTGTVAIRLRSAPRRSRGARTALRAGGRYVIAPLVTILVASFVVFLALNAAPGDPVARILGGTATDAQRAALRTELGLDQPLLARYASWIVGALHGDFGISYTYRSDVSALIGPRILTTTLLVVMAGILIVLIGTSIGTLSGLRRRLRPWAALLAAVGIAVPSFVAASALVAVFAVGLGWFPTYGAGDGFLDRVWHLVLPAIALAIGWTAYVIQMTGVAVAEEAGKDHVATATGRGIPRSAVVRRHVLRNASLPILTVAAVTVAGLVAGSVIVEGAFALDGLGSLLVSAVSDKDAPVVLAVSLIIICVFVVATTLIDVAHRLLDPRMRRAS